MSSNYRLRDTIFPMLESFIGKSFLDIACGFGAWGQYIKDHCFPSYLIGLDIWKPYLLKVKQKYIYDDLILADVTNLPFKEKTIDVCVACEIVEHLHKQKGMHFLSFLKSISREKIIVSTPNYNYHQDGARGNPYEKHVSFWRDTDLKKEGFKVKGIGFKFYGKYVFSMLPFFGKFLGRVKLSHRFSMLAELIVGEKEV